MRDVGNREDLHRVQHQLIDSGSVLIPIFGLEVTVLLVRRSQGPTVSLLVYEQWCVAYRSYSFM